MSIVKPAIQFPVLIAYLEGANNYTWLHFRDGEKRLLAKPISYMEEQPELIDFIRIHKTILVNPACVERVLEPPRAKMAGAVQLAGGMVLPVSRRRWSQVARLLEDKLATTPGLRSRLVTPQPAPISAALPDAAPRLSIIAVTGNPLSALLLTEVASQYWPHYTLHVLTEATTLPDRLGRLPRTELPVLLVLDARTSRQERLNALQLIKQSDHLGWIPVVLLLSPTDGAIYDGYYRQANSVITVGPAHTQFVEMIKRIGQFWLETATLPQTTEADG